MNKYELPPVIIGAAGIVTTLIVLLRILKIKKVRLPFVDIQLQTPTKTSIDTPPIVAEIAVDLEKHLQTTTDFGKFFKSKTNQDLASCNVNNRRSFEKPL